MTSLLIECALRSALVAMGTAAILWILRIKTASARHHAWTGVLLVMLLLPIWTAFGPRAYLRVLPSPLYLEQALLTKTHQSTDLETVLLGVYLLGACILGTRLAIGTVRTHVLMRGAIPRNGRLTSKACAVPITMGCFRPVVILPEHWQQWSESRLDAVLTHEHEHARRRDPLIQWLALLNRALFWFNPISWWLERRLAALAEEACDVAVLSRGHSPSDYCECLLDLARSVTRVGGRLNPVGMTMPGNYLPQRIRRILDGLPTLNMSRSRKASLLAACVVSSVLLTITTLDRPLRATQARQQAACEGANDLRTFSRDNGGLSVGVVTKYIIIGLQRRFDLCS